MLEQEIFTVGESNFRDVALKVFQFQYEQNLVYRQYCQSLPTDISHIDTIEKIPFLPVSFFKSHQIVSTQFEPVAIFESSGTSATINSRHFIKNVDLYEQSFTSTFRHFYGDPQEWCILALLPSYLERNNSSLVVMADNLIKVSTHPQSGFYLYNMEELKTTLVALEQQQQKTLLIGVTFALLDFAKLYPIPLAYTTIMETGGMKGRRKEMPREQVHDILKAAFQTPSIHSEYGMTELLSQAYSFGHGSFNAPAWMKILIREEDDPFELHTAETIINSGAINIIDLANLYSCSFIATEDVGKLHPDGSFEITGRLDNSALRGCSLMAV